MNRFLKIVTFFTFIVFLSSCASTSDPVPETPAAPYGEQYPKDLAAIETYLTENYMDVSTDGNFDVTFNKIPTPNTAGKVAIKNQTQFPLLEKIVSQDGINYKVYYISFREGTQDRATRVDSVYTSYKGQLLTNVVFDQAPNPIWLTLDNVIQGWKEIFPKFKTGTNTIASNGTINYSNFGAGIMFLPSALAYYNQAVGTIPSYSPLIFTFKIKNLNYVDSDYDGIDSKDEDLNANGIFTDDDTDGDGRANYLDQDDDGDGYLTKQEIRKPDNTFYPFALIPACGGGSLKRHLDSSCH